MCLEICITYICKYKTSVHSIMIIDKIITYKKVGHIAKEIVLTNMEYLILSSYF